MVSRRRLIFGAAALALSMLTGHEHLRVDAEPAVLAKSVTEAARADS